MAANSTPHVNLLNIPFCKTVKVLAPKDGRQLQKRTKPVEDHSGPFIFSPFASMNNAANKPNNVFDFQWVEGDVVEVVLQFENPLSIPLQLSNIKLLTEGPCQMESWSSSVVLEGEACAAVTVRGQASCPGQLKIMGYVVTALGVTSTCRFKHLQHLKVPYYVMQVVPALPFLQVDAEKSSTTSDSLTIESEAGGGKIRGALVAGETRDLTLALENTSSKPVTNVAIVIKTKVNSEKVFSISEEELSSQLPIEAGGCVTATLTLYGFADFLAMAYDEDGFNDNSSSATARSGSLGAPSSLLSAPLTNNSSRIGASSSYRSSSLAPRPSARSSNSSAGSFFSGSSGSSSSKSTSHAAVTAAAAIARAKPLTSIIEGDIEIWYSGTSDENWRICHLSIKLQIVPTLQIIRWLLAK